jgi:hypothetical protein
MGPSPTQRTLQYMKNIHTFRNQFLIAGEGGGEGELMIIIIIIIIIIIMVKEN